MKKKKEPNLTLLGQAKPLPARPSADILEVFPNRHQSRDYWVEFETTEFTSLCPITGQPDFGRIFIEYVPNKFCVESKSLKFYLASFRSEGTFVEGIVNRILEDFVHVCSPREVRVRGEFVARGGVTIAVEAEYPEDGRHHARNGGG